MNRSCNHMFYGVSTFLLVFLVSYGKSSVCEDPCNNPSLVQILEASVVKDDPFPLFKDELSDVWFRRFYKEVYLYHCSWKEYILQGDKLVKKEMYRTSAGGIDKEFNKEFVSRTDKTGVLEIQGSYDGASQIYYGRIYVFYSDANAIGVFFCSCKTYDWNANIQIPSKLAKMLTENSDNDVKKSLAAAEKAWQSLVTKQSETIPENTDVYPDLKKDDLIKINLEDVCWKNT